MLDDEDTRLMFVFVEKIIGWFLLNLGPLYL